MFQGVVYSLLLRFALMLLEVGLQLLPGLLEVEQELLARAEGQAANVAIRQARDLPDKSCDLKISFCHGNIMAGHGSGVKLRRKFRRRFFLTSPFPI
jgi:hypothetical protein